MKDKRGEKCKLSIIMVNESKNEKKIFLLIKKLLIKLNDINTIKILSFIGFNCILRVSKILIVSAVLKYKGARITKDPLRNKKKFSNLILLFIPKTASSLPKWYAAIIKKIVKVNNGKINQIPIIAKEIKIYPA